MNQFTVIKNVIVIRQGTRTDIKENLPESVSGIMIDMAETVEKEATEEELEREMIIERHKTN